MVARALNASESIRFAQPFKDHFGVLCAGFVSGAAWGYIIWYPTPRKIVVSGAVVDLYSTVFRSSPTPGGNTFSAKAGWKIVDKLAANFLRLEVPCDGDTLVNKRYNLCTGNPSNLPIENSTGAQGNSGNPTESIDVYKWFIPSWVSSSQFSAYMDGVLNSTKPIGSSNFPFINRDVEISPLRMNDLGQNVTPFYKSNNRKRL